MAEQPSSYYMHGYHILHDCQGSDSRCRTVRSLEPIVGSTGLSPASPWKARDTMPKYEWRRSIDLVSNTFSESASDHLTRRISGSLPKPTDEMLGLFEQVSTIAIFIDHGILVQHLASVLVDNHYQTGGHLPSMSPRSRMSSMCLHIYCIGH